jgi:hypothetical protein
VNAISAGLSIGLEILQSFRVKLDIIYRVWYDPIVTLCIQLFTLRYVLDGRHLVYRNHGSYITIEYHPRGVREVNTILYLSLYSHRRLTEMLKTLSKVFRAVESIHQTYSFVQTRPRLHPRPLSLSRPPIRGKSLPSPLDFQLLYKPRHCSVKTPNG